MGVRQRVAAALKAIANDYRTVFVDMGKSARSNPVRTAVGAALLGGALFVGSRTPGERDYKAGIIDAHIRLGTVGFGGRKREAETHVAEQMQLLANGLVEVQELGLLSIAYRREDPPWLCTARAIYGPLAYDSLSPASWQERIVDVGFFGKWWRLEDKMRDYDVAE